MYLKSNEGKEPLLSSKVSESEFNFNTSFVESTTVKDHDTLNDYIKTNIDLIAFRDKQSEHPIEIEELDDEITQSVEDKDTSDQFYSQEQISMTRNCVNEKMHIWNQSLSNKFSKSRRDTTTSKNSSIWDAIGAKCDKGHDIKYVVSNVSAESGISYTCNHCGLGELNKQQLGHFQCKNTKCNPKDENMNSNRFLLCLACAFSQDSIKLPEILQGNNASSNKLSKPLELTITPWFHQHTIRRHPINIKTQWACYGYDQNKCESEINTIIVNEQKEQDMNQGYECTECNWHICIGCLIRYQSYQVMSNDKCQLPDQLEITEALEVKKAQEQLLPKYLYKQLLAQQIFQIRDVETDRILIQGQKPMKIFNDYQQDFIQKCLLSEDNQKLKKINIKVQSYTPTEDDKDKMLENLPKSQPFSNQYVIKKKEYQIVQKPKQESIFLIIKTIEQLAIPSMEEGMSNLIKTLRVYDFNPSNQPMFKKKQDILLEQVPGYDYNNNLISYNQISVIEFNYKIFFWRRRKNQQDQWETQLWRYSIEADELSEVIYNEVVQDGKPIDNVKRNILPENQGIKSQRTTRSFVDIVNILNQQSRQLHVMFANQVGYYNQEIVDWSQEELVYNTKKEKQIKKDLRLSHENRQEMQKEEHAKLKRMEEKQERLFLDQQFILKQHYYFEKSPQQIEKENNLKKQKKKIKEQDQEILQNSVVKNIFGDEFKKLIKNKDDKKQKKKESFTKKVREKREFTIAKLDNPSVDLIKDNNRGAAYPITQFFMFVEPMEINQICNHKFCFTLMDDKTYSLSFNTLLKNSKTSFYINKQLPVYDDWIQGGNEVQWIPINLPTFKGTVYFLLKKSKEDTQIVIIHPNEDINENTFETIIEYIKSKLVSKGRIEKNGKRVFFMTNRKYSNKNNQNKIWMKKLNRDFLKIVQKEDKEKTFVEKMDEYKDLLTTKFVNCVDLCIVSNTFYSFLIGNSVNDETSIEGYLYYKTRHRIHNGVLEKEENNEQKEEQMSLSISNKSGTQDQQNIKNLIINKDTQNVLKTIYNTDPFQSIFRSHLKSMMYSFNYVKFTMTADERKNEKLPGFQNEESVLLHQKDSAIDQNLANGFYKMSSNDINSYFIQVKDPKYRAWLKGAQFYRGNLCPQGSLTPVTYYIGTEFYTFVATLKNRHWFFIRVTIKQMTDICNGIGQILYNSTEIYWLDGIRSTKKMFFKELVDKQDSWLEDKTETEYEKLYILHCVCEKVVDQVEMPDFVPFLAIKVTKSDTDNKKYVNILKAKQTYFNIFSINDCKIKSSVPCNVPNSVVQDLDAFNIRLSKSSNLEQDEELGKSDEEFERQQQCRYLVGFFFKNQAQRFIFKEIQVTAKYKVENHVNHDNQKTIKTEFYCYQIGQRELISSTIQFNEFEISDKFDMIPYIVGKQGTVGVQLVLGDTSKDEQTKFQIVTMINSKNFNNIYQYQSKVATFGYQKFYNLQNSEDKDSENAAYFLLVSAKINQIAVRRCNLDNCEILILLRDLLDNLKHQIEFRFEYIILNNFDSIKNTNFFNQHEMFMGHSMVNAHLNDLDSIQQALMKPNIFSNKHSLIQNTIPNDKEREAKFTRDGIMRGITMTNNDFNFDNEIEKAFSLKEVLAQKFLLEKIMQLDDIKYSKHIIQILSMMFMEPDFNQNVPYILEFFNRNKENQENQNFCNLEVFMFDPRLPIKSAMESEYIAFSKFDDYNMLEDEIIRTLYKRDQEETKALMDLDNITNKIDSMNQKNSKTVAVEHSYMDFQWLILNEKLRGLAGVKPKDYYGKVYFAELMVQENIEFYLQDTIQKFIDYQFQQTFRFFLMNLLIYVVFFFLPFMVVIFRGDLKENNYKHEKIACMFSCLWTQIYFFIWEFLQFKQVGITYLHDIQNIFDIGQCAVYIVTFIGILKENSTHTQSMVDQLLGMFIVVQAFYKIMFFLKIFPDYGFLVQMVLQSIKKVREFLVFFVLWILFFSIQYKIMGVNYPDGPSTQKASTFFEIFLASLRITIGDVQIPEIAKSPTGSAASYIITFFVWTTWFFNLFLMLIILMNFLIAVIQDSYTEVDNAKIQYVYKGKAEMNLDCQQQLARVFPQQDLKCVSFSTDKQAWSEMVDPNSDLKTTVKEYMDKQEKNIQDNINSVYTKIMFTVNQLQDDMKQNQIESRQNHDVMRDKQEKVYDAIKHLIQLKDNEGPFERRLTEIKMETHIIKDEEIQRVSFVEDDESNDYDYDYDQ